MIMSCRSGAAAGLGVLFLFIGAMQAGDSTDIQVTCPGATHSAAPEAGGGPGIEDSRLPGDMLLDGTAH